MPAAQTHLEAAPPLSVRWPPLPQVLNEVVIDRGPSSYLSNVDVYLDGHLITTVQGDGTWASGLSWVPWDSTRAGGAWRVSLRGHRVCHGRLGARRLWAHGE